MLVLSVVTAKVTGQALILIALMAQAVLDAGNTQVLIQVLIFGGICVQAGITILTHRWDNEDRARKQQELLSETAGVKREVVATTQLQLSATNTAVAEIKAEVKKPDDDSAASDKEARES